MFDFLDPIVSFVGDVFSGVKDAIGSVGSFGQSMGMTGSSVLGAGASAYAADMAYKGTQETNAANIAQAQANRDFQERMSSTAYQRATQDMAKAGLNPMLGYSQGGASTPGGAMPAPMQSAKVAAVNSALSTAQSYQQVQKTAAETQNIKADTEGKQWYAATEMERSYTQQQITAKARYEVEQANAMVNKVLADTQLTKEQIVKVRKETINAVLTGEQIEARTGNIRVDTELAKLDIPRAKNVSAAEESWWKQNVAPYLGDVGSVTGSAVGVARALRGGGVSRGPSVRDIQDVTRRYMKKD